MVFALYGRDIGIYLYETDEQLLMNEEGRIFG